jgi:hypothetical protein
MRSRQLVTVLAIVATFGSINACGKDKPPPTVDDTRSPQGQTNRAPPEPQAHPTGMSTEKKVVLLAGAAALYWMYKHHQNSAAAAAGPDGQYYLSKNGRVYYRDAEHRAHWVTPPPEGVRVPESEAAEYKQFQGYDGNAQGRDLVGLGTDE